MDNYFFNGYIVNQQARARRSGGQWGLYYYLFLNLLLTPTEDQKLCARNLVLLLILILALTPYSYTYAFVSNSKKT